MQYTTRVFFITLAMGFSTAAWSDQEILFDQGVEAFREQNYEYALDVFKLARDEEGMSTLELHYNIGVSEYKLGHYERAEISFMRLLNDPRYQPLAYYNLGLVALRLNNIPDAIDWFEIASKSDKSKIRKAARGMLAKLGKKPRKPQLISDFAGAVFARVGTDSNVNSVTDDSALNVSDTFYEIYAVVDRPVFGNRNKGVSLNASLFRLDYTNVNEEDFDQLKLGVTYKTKLGKWRTRARLFVSQGYLDSLEYQQHLGLEFKGRLKLSKESSIQLRYQYFDISSLDIQFDELEGNRQKIRIQHRYKKPLYSTRLIYDMEVNDRADTTTRSFSPTRNTIRGVYTRNIDEKLRWRVDLAFRKTSYPDVIAGSGRDDDRVSLSLYLLYRLPPDWVVRAKYRRKQNTSSDPSRDYDRDIISAGFSYVF